VGGQQLNNALRSSMIGGILHSLTVALCRKKYTSNAKMASGLLPLLINLLSSVNKLNVALPQAADADQKYLDRFSSKKDKKYFVETKHPYSQGKNQLKQTITVRGAEALCLYFDSRSRTANAGSDILQLFKSATINDPVTTGKDGKAMTFSGTNFPKQAVIIPGDTVTLMFTATSRPDKNVENNKARWGFKCRITGICLLFLKKNPTLS